MRRGELGRTGRSLMIGKHQWRWLLGSAVVLAALALAPVSAWSLPGPLQAALQLAQLYAREHVLWGLLPALFMAGGLATFLDRALVLQHLSSRASRFLAYGVASIAGAVLAACSCAVLPLFAGIYRMGAGLGPATTFLFAGPAINVAAISLTASVLGLNLAVARCGAALLGSVGIGLAMAALFAQKPSVQASVAMPEPCAPRPVWKSALVLALMLVAVVTVNWSASGHFSFTLACCPKPLPKFIEDAPDQLRHWPGRLFYVLQPGETNPYPGQPLYHGHVEIQQADIVDETTESLLLRSAAGVEVRLGKERIRGVEPPIYRQGIVVGQDADHVFIRDAQGQTTAIPRHTIQQAVPVAPALSHWLHRARFAITGGIVALLGLLLRRWFAPAERQLWLQATYDLGRALLPKLLLGVLLTGLLLGCPDPTRLHSSLVPGLLPLGWIERALGGNSLWANLVASVAGVFLYVATLTEVPLVQGLLSGGMGHGPALALLLAGPALSLPSMLMIAGVLGLRRTAAFVGLVVLLSALVGWAVGPWL